ncbi:hypothetical protein QYE76_001992 [Lolium multiflorum]|uniref:CCHC-type domain-containing protein n=1 Tax=Lolium multiflorum TaxID=4521 RepID=A0AAD8VXV6_LOLMU|nr:hypothetical protein QYE76_001992 [Lolium multiflorum]
MASSASHPPGFPLRWQRSRSVDSASPSRKDHVLGLGLSSASSGNSVAMQRAEAPVHAPAEERGRVQDRLVWEQPRPLKRSMWRRRVEARNAAAAPSRGAVAPEMDGLCFRCYEPGHRKRDCMNEEVCIRCWLRGHPAKECKRPRSPTSEDELRSLALAKFARRGSPERERPPRVQRFPGRAPAPPPPRLEVAPPPPPPQPPSPPLPPPPPHGAPASALPPLGGWPPLRVEPLCPAPEPVSCLTSMEEAPTLCVVRRTAAMCDLERRLRFAMVASVGGRRPTVSCEQVSVALKWRGIPASSFSVHAHAPEDFLVVLESAELRRHVSAMPPVLVAGAPLVFRPWNRQSQASQVSLRSRVSLAIEGIPPHAWDVEVVENLLGRSCAVEEVASETRSRADLSLFKLAAWTSDVEAIPVARILAVPEPLELGQRQQPSPSPAPASATASVAEEIKTLQYKVLIHVVSIEEDEAVESVRRSGASGSEEAWRSTTEGGGGGAGGAAGRRSSRSFSWKRGVPDRRGGPGGRPIQRGGEVGTHVAACERMGWDLPYMATAAPITVQIPLPLVEGSSGKRPDSAGQSSAAVVSDQGKGKSAEKGMATYEETGSRPVEQKVEGHVRETDVQPGLEDSPNMRGNPIVHNTGQDLGPPFWQDAHDSLPIGADPEEDPVAGPTLPSDAPQKVAHYEAEQVFSTTPVRGKNCMAGLEEGTTWNVDTKGSSTPVDLEQTMLSSPGSSVASSSGTCNGCSEREGYVQISISTSKRSASLDPPGPDVECLGGSLSFESDPVGSPCKSFTGPNSAMQMVPHTAPTQMTIATVQEAVGDPGVEETTLQQERMALNRIKMFCTAILKKLAPPLLREVEATSGLRADVEPFTPRRITRRAAAIAGGMHAKKASSAETVQLKALGIYPEELAVNEEHLGAFNEMFDSPLGERQVRVMAAIFGKVVPPSFDRPLGCQVAVAAR